ncbi:class I SAM-dependent methyltransferase [Desulfovibrio aminophilus]|nr:class I SAM-dependent methyltransferase [Desulfovibrio aminophilus]MCM0753981.1 class I SAM-dependent methyltransferase [Desulfovibrio aminophilus]
MKNRIHCIGLDYNETFARGFNLDVVDVDAARAAAGAFLNGGLENRKGVIYGAGTSGALALRLLPEGAATGFLDVAPAKKSFQGLRVEHPAQASWGGFALIAVSPANYLSVMKTIAGLAPEGCDLYFLWKYEFFDPEAWARLHSGDGSRPRVADHRPEGEAGDNRGRIFFEGGRTFRTILEQDFEFFRDLARDTARLGRLTANGLIETSVHLDTPERLVLEHKSLLPQSRANWSFSQYLDAARFFVDFWDFLTSEGYSLQDCHTGNVLFDGTRPRFVDLCSIGPREATTLSVPFLESFFQSWVHPLALVASRQNVLMRDTVNDLLPWEDVRPLLSPEAAESAAALREEGLRRFRDMDVPGFLAAARRWLDSVTVGYSDAGWNNERYQADDLRDDQPRGGKEQLVVDLIGRHRPESFLDLGCNKGRFSLLAALRGVSCVSLDTAESLVDKLYLHARDRNLPIQAFIEDVAALRGYTKPDRAFDMVAYLALVHHLVFTFGRSVDQVLDQADALCRRVLLLEYVRPHESEPFVLSNYSPAIHTDYNPEAIARLMRKRFGAVEAHELCPTRVLFVGSR